jgi:tripartite-type tricarboxylate transporter receptor subunit TctC
VARSADSHRRPVRAGGASDILARLIAKELTERLKQPVIVENKPGAGGTIGADLVAKSPPDGYTLLLADSSVLMTFPTLYPNLPYAYKDLVPVANIATFGLILIAPASSRFNTLAEVIAYDKATPASSTWPRRKRLVQSPDAGEVQRRGRHQDRSRSL